MTGRYQVDSSGCSSHRMLLGTGRDRTLPGWQRWMLAPSDAFRNPQSLSWQPWKLPDSRFSYTPGPPTGSASAMRDASRVCRTSKTRHVMCLRTHAGQVPRAGAGVAFLQRYGCSGPQTSGVYSLHAPPTNFGAAQWAP